MHNFVTKDSLIILLKTNHSAFSPILYLYYMPNYSIIYHFFFFLEILPLDLPYSFFSLFSSPFKSLLVCVFRKSYYSFVLII